MGAGFARLVGPEGARRSPSRITSVEDALRELLRNSRDAGASAIYVASTLRNRRFRKLTVIDDGCGIPESHKDLVFEPGITTRHLNPILHNVDPAPHGAGLSLYHLKNAATHAEVVSTGGPGKAPTSITATFDTRKIPERSLQSKARNSRTNLLATLQTFLKSTTGIQIYHSSPANILATFLQNHIIQTTDAKEAWVKGNELGLGVSLRTVQRIIKGELDVVEAVSSSDRVRRREGSGAGGREGIRVSLGQNEMDEIEAILRRIVRARYLEMGDLRVESRPGEMSFKVQVYELEDEYE